MEALKVTDPTKTVDDPVLLTHLERQGIDKDYVELTSDYGKSVKGKSSPCAKFYQDLKSGKQFMVVQQLPMADADGTAIEAGWQATGKGYQAKNNYFDAEVAGLETTITIRNDQPDGRKAGQQVVFQPQLFLNGVEQKPSDVALLGIDTCNENYTNNTLEWDYGSGKRRLRLIEGAMLGYWVFEQNPGGEVSIKYNQSGDFRLNLGQYAISSDEELINKEQFNQAIYPLTVSDSATFYSGSGDGIVGNSGATYATVQSAGTGNEIDASSDNAAIQNGKYSTTYYVRRFFLPFDTSSLDDTAIITAATLSIYSQGTQAQSDTGHSNIKPYEGTQAATLTTADFDSFNTTLLTDDASPWEYPLATNAYETVSLNTAGLALINKAGTTKYCLRLSGDVNASQPAGNNYSYIYMSEKGSGYQPKLVVTFTTGEAKTSGDSGIGAEAISLRELGAAESGSGAEMSLAAAALLASDVGSGSEMGGLLQSLFSQDEGGGADKVRILTGKAGYDLKLHSHRGQVSITHKEVNL